MKGGPGQKGPALLPCAPAASPPGQHRGPRPGWPRVGGGSSSVMSRHASLRRRERAPFPHLLGHRARFQERLVPRRPGPPCRLDDGRTNEKARHRTQHMPVVARGASCGRGQSRGLPRRTRHPTSARLASCCPPAPGLLCSLGSSFQNTPPPPPGSQERGHCGHGLRIFSAVPGEL